MTKVAAHLARSLIASAATLALACGSGATPAPAPPPLDTSPGERPPGVLAELELDAEASLEALRAPLDDEALRALLPARIVDLVEAEVTLPGELRRRLRPERGARALAFSAEPGETSVNELELVWAFGLEPLEASGAEPADALPTEAGAPRGARWVTGEPIAIAGDVAVAGATRARVEAALAYLAFTAMPRDAGSGRLTVTLAQPLLERALRPVADAALVRTARDARASAEAAMRAHAEPPALGAPDRFVDRVRARLAEWIAYLPDLTELRVALHAEGGGLALELDAAPAEGSPLAVLMGGMPTGDLGAIASLPEGTALGIVHRSSAEARRARSERWLADVADVAGERLAPAERALLAATVAAWDDALGEASLWALGRTEAGLFSLVAGPDAPAPAEGGDAALRPFWGPRARPYETALVASLAGCDPTEPRAEAPLAVCAGARFEAARAERGPFVVSIAPEDAGPFAEATLTALGTARPVLGASPDVARALAPHTAPGIFGVALVPSRVLGVLAALERVRGPTESPPAMLVLSARPGEGGRVSVLVTADAAAVRDAIALGRTLSSP